MLSLIHDLADDFADEIQQLCNTEVTNDQWQRFLDLHVPRHEPDGRPLPKRAATLAGTKRDALQHLYRTDPRVAPWAGTAHGVLQAANTYAHHLAPVRGVQRAERNMLKALSGDFGKADREALAALQRVLA